MQCFRCDQPAVQECPRCGALYCDDHGDALCERCMDPASAMPSYRVYRGSLAALMIGSIFAVWLLVRPGGEADQDGPPAALAAVLPTATPTTRPARPAGTSTPASTSTAPAGSPTPAASTATPRLTAAPATATASAERSHTVKTGDTLYGIADQYRGSTDLQTFLERIYSANGLRENSLLSLGDVVKLP